MWGVALGSRQVRSLSTFAPVLIGQHVASEPNTLQTDQNQPPGLWQRHGPLNGLFTAEITFSFFFLLRCFLTSPFGFRRTENKLTSRGQNTLRWFLPCGLSPFCGLEDFFERLYRNILSGQRYSDKHSGMKRILYPCRKISGHVWM